MTSDNLPCAIIAGGLSTRMGGDDKCLLDLAGRSILARVIAALAPQVGAIIINSNSDPRLFASFGYDVRADALPGQLGPLAGILTALEWAKDAGAAAVVTASGDTPFLPEDLVARLAAAADPSRPVVAASGGRLHPVIGLWPATLAAQLRTDLDGGARSMVKWLDGLPFSTVEFPIDGGDPFANINTPDDLAAAAKRISTAE